jgi:tRNA U34 5-carboxymethylaminomethyl modifying GTPase MnmE/TrmE
MPNNHFDIAEFSGIIALASSCRKLSAAILQISFEEAKNVLESILNEINTRKMKIIITHIFLLRITHWTDYVKRNN